jgi:hypothetical protein
MQNACVFAIHIEVVCKPEFVFASAGERVL